MESIYDYFKNVIKFHSFFDIPVTWITPAGVEVTQFYNMSVQNKVSIRFSNKTNKVVLRQKTSKLDKRKQVNAIIPNIIHSLDASHLMKIIISAKRNSYLNILSVHDCFGTYPNHVGEMIEIVKEEFIKLYTN